MIRIFVGWDAREACAFHVFNQSVIENCSKPVQIIPLAENLLQFDGQQDGSNAFIYSRYLVPSLCNFEGWALFCDGDQIVRSDITELWKKRDPTKAVQVVKHEYQTQHSRKYIGSPLESKNVDYPRKNWSSVILWNCGHPSNRILTKEFVAEAGGALLHRFQWITDDEIGELPEEWNGLVEEQDTSQAKLLHFTLGVPGFSHYQRCNDHRIWNRYLLSALRLEGERPEEVVRRAAWRH
jgi:lipopolysaccharide biosynthesis glycosyltransferase